jgi:tRNA pseudouridine38-40 synthase
MRSTVRRALVSELVEDGPMLVYRVEATAFLKHMVRNIVGTLVEIGRGDRPADSIAGLIAGRDRTRAGDTAPPHGLVLIAVRY